MKKKIILLGITATAMLAVASIGILKGGNTLISTSGEATERTIKFTSEDGVVSSGGSSFYVSSEEYGKNLFEFKSTFLGNLVSYGVFQINCGETNSIAKFATLNKISFTYSIPGPEKNLIEVYIGDAETESFDGASIYYLDGSNGSETSTTLYMNSSDKTNKIIKVRNKSPFRFAITSFSITYTC